LATRIARLATEQAIADRDGPSDQHHSSMIRASEVEAIEANCPLDSDEPDFADDDDLGNEAVPFMDIVDASTL